MNKKSALTSSSKGRGRPAITTEQREEMRARIAGEAKRLFQTEGYSQVSMRRISKEIGCAPMTLYKYYEAKIDILRRFGEMSLKMYLTVSMPFKSVTVHQRKG